MKTKTEEFLHHAARAFFACAWADMAEECDSVPWPAGGEIMAYMPETVDPAATHAAKTLWFDIERVNGKTIEELMRIVETDGDGDRPNTPEFFGHYCAMQAMGHGVGLSDAFGSEVYEKITVPYVDFGSHSLDRDYFVKNENKKSESFFFAEITDTFGGEANYSWVTRHKIKASTIRGAVNKLSRYSGISWRINGDYGDSLRYDSKSGASCFFISEWDEETHSQYSRVNEI